MDDTIIPHWLFQEHKQVRFSNSVVEFFYVADNTVDITAHEAIHETTFDIDPKLPFIEFISEVYDGYTICVDVEKSIVVYPQNQDDYIRTYKEVDSTHWECQNVKVYDDDFPDEFKYIYTLINGQWL